jgi:hypothetical protein
MAALSRELVVLSLSYIITMSECLSVSLSLIGVSEYFRVSQYVRVFVFAKNFDTFEEFL